MNHIKIRTDLIKNTFNLLRPEEGLNCVFKKGSISMEYKSGIIASIKSPLAFFEGALESYLFSKLGDLRKEFLYLRIHNYTLKIRSGSLHIDLYLAPEKNPDVGIDLWSPSIKWYPCRQDIVNGICRVADLLPGSSPIDVEDLLHSVIHIVDGHVIAFDRYPFRASRYKISLPPPFNISLFPMGIRQAFARIKNRKLLGVADFHRGMAFDFGIMRIWIPGVKVPESDNYGGDRGAFVHHGRNWIISAVTNLLSLPCMFIITIPPDLKNFPAQIRSMPANDNLITLIFMKDEIRLRYESKSILAFQNTIPTKINMPKYAIKIQVNPFDFKKALIGMRLMGLMKTSESGFFLYFKNKLLEHSIPARQYIKEEEETCYTKKKPKEFPEKERSNLETIPITLSN